MAIIHTYTPDGVYYECAANGKKYTGEEWHTYCAANRNNDCVVAEYFGFEWNIHDVCLNPNTTEIYRDNRSFIEIKTAQRKDGMWTVGNSYLCLSGHQDDYGGGCGCRYDSTAYQTEDEAIVAMLEWFKQREGLKPKITTAIQKAIFDRKCKQLTLF